MNKQKALQLTMTILILLLLVVITFLIFRMNDHEENSLLDVDGRPKFENISNDGDFVVYRGGVAKNFTGRKNVKLEWYTDALCPDCTRAHTTTEDFIFGQIDSGSIEIKFHVLNFLPQYSPEGYSLRAASWVLGAAEFAPDNIKDFMSLVFAESDVEIPARDDVYFKELAKQADISQENIDLIEKNLFLLEAMVNKASVGIRQNQNLINMSPEERMFVPFIFVSGKTDSALRGEAEDTQTEIIDPIQSLLDNFDVTPCGNANEEGCY
ncbi:MAG TPA: thioredoxin domain-containing protein [Clostridiaceae bacterium]|nr:thioredoxin domain-containing protein [Clostridiaceae bacterium]